MRQINVVRTIKGMLLVVGGSIFISAMMGCNKSSTPVNAFQFQLGNTVYMFDSVSASVDTPSAYITSIYAENTKTKSHVGIQLQSNAATIPGIYSHISPTPGNSILIDFSVLIVNGPTYGSYTVEGAPFTFTIDQAGNKRLSGKFSGIIADLIGPQNDTIQNGQFRIPFTYQ